jgi:putative transposase
MSGQEFKALYHCVYSLRYHLVLVTKYRRRCLTAPMREALRTICETQLAGKGGVLLELNAEEDHVHLLIELPSKTSLSIVANSLKTVIARLLRRDYSQHLAGFYRKPVLWSRSYFIASCGGAPLAVIRQYIEQQKALPEG